MDSWFVFYVCSVLFSIWFFSYSRPLRKSNLICFLFGFHHFYYYWIVCIGCCTSVHYFDLIDAGLRGCCSVNKTIGAAERRTEIVCRQSWSQTWKNGFNFKWTWFFKTEVVGVGAQSGNKGNEKQLKTSYYNIFHSLHIRFGFHLDLVLLWFRVSLADAFKIRWWA